MPYELFFLELKIVGGAGIHLLPPAILCADGSRRSAAEKL
jgi:hypothetical protein